MANDDNTRTGEVVAYKVEIFMIECPNCEVEFQVPDDLCAPGEGFKTNCPTCESEVTGRCGY